jgi:DNA-binding NtrC family response regulator
MDQLRSVLVVEDDRVLCETLVGLLEDEKFDVMTASTLTRARYIIFQSTHPVGVLLLDLQLADGAGETLLDELSAYAKAPPVVLMSARADRAAPAGSAYGVPALSKPLDLAVVVASVRTAFEQRLCPLPEGRARSGAHSRVAVKLDA